MISHVSASVIFGVVRLPLTNDKREAVSWRRGRSNNAAGLLSTSLFSTFCFVRSRQMKLRRGSGSNLLFPSHLASCALMEQVGMLISLCVCVCACSVCRYMSTVTHD